MKKRIKKSLFLILFLLFWGLDFYNRDSEYSITGRITNNFNQEKGIKIANWNLQIFGIAKAKNNELMNFYKEKINDYDIIFVQEIRDETGTAFNKLCLMLEEYNCEISSRAGRTNNKEQYGVIYNKSIKLNYFRDYNPDPQNRWERPPIEVSFDLKEFNITIFNIHVKPDDAIKELDFLDDFILNNGYKLILGDLNMDCSYYDNKIENEFENWNFIIEDVDDTTSGDSNCAYDRIIAGDLLKDKIIRYGIDKKGIDKESDHYLIWLEIKE